MRAVLATLSVAVLTSPALAAEPVAIGNAFAIDRTEVTIAEFRDYAATAKLVTAAEREGGGFEFGAGWERRPGWSVYRPFGEEPADPNEPAVHVSWEEARAFCEAKGGRLPTAHEWAKAAFEEKRAQPPDGFLTGITYQYPTGDEPAGMNTTGFDAWPRHAPAGTTTPGVNGLFDMGGNVWEWLADRQGDTALTAGGSWWYGPDKATKAAMQWKQASFYAVYVGFRCTYASKG